MIFTYLPNPPSESTQMLSFSIKVFSFSRSPLKAATVTEDAVAHSEKWS